MSNAARDEELQAELVEAFTELGPTWVRWVNACLPADAVSYARLRLLSVLQCDGQQTMSQLAAALDVSARRVTVLVEALDADGLVERRRHPTDGRSTLVAITDAGIKHQAHSWEQHRAEVGQAFGDLPAHQQKQLLAISRALTSAMRTRLAGRAAPQQPPCTTGARPPTAVPSPRRRPRAIP